MPVHKPMQSPATDFVGHDWSDRALLDRPDEREREKKCTVCLEIAAAFLAFATVKCETTFLQPQRSTAEQYGRFGRMSVPIVRV